MTDIVDKTVLLNFIQIDLMENRNIFDRLINMFKIDLTSELRAVESAIAMKDSNLVTQIVHKLKPSIISFGAVVLMASLTKIEEQCLALKYDSLEDLVKKAIDIAEKTIFEITAIAIDFFAKGAQVA